MIIIEMPLILVPIFHPPFRVSTPQNYLHNHNDFRSLSLSLEAVNPQGRSAGPPSSQQMASHPKTTPGMKIWGLVTETRNKRRVACLKRLPCQTISVHVFKGLHTQAHTHARWEKRDQFAAVCSTPLLLFEAHPWPQAALLIWDWGAAPCYFWDGTWTRGLISLPHHQNSRQ